MSTITESKKELLDKWRSECKDEKLIKVFEEVPREEFVPDGVKNQAYLDQPLQIGHEQTISQPSTVMNMLSLLDVSSGHKVLEIGAGSGYVCALLAKLGCEVYGIEIVPELSVNASKVIEKIGLSDKVHIHSADGGGGWEENAPYDRILISAAVPEVPRNMLWQLKNSGILVVPVGTVEQRMIVCKKKKEDEIVEEDHGAYVFVPLTGKYSEEGQDDVPNMPFL
jgi:protein-L-isoaspartate(D-aspartate) O-methyltransferase